MREFTIQFMKRRFPISALANDMPGLLSALLAYAIAAFGVVMLTADGIATDAIRGLSYAVRTLGSAYCLGGAILAWRYYTGSLPDESELDENGVRKVPIKKKDPNESGVTVIKKDVPAATAENKATAKSTPAQNVQKATAENAQNTVAESTDATPAAGAQNAGEASTATDEPASAKDAEPLGGKDAAENK